MRAERGARWHLSRAAIVDAEEEEGGEEEEGEEEEDEGEEAAAASARETEVSRQSKNSSTLHTNRIMLLLETG